MLKHWEHWNVSAVKIWDCQSHGSMRIQIKEALKCKNRENGNAEKTEGTEMIGAQDCGSKETQKYIIP